MVKKGNATANQVFVQWAKDSTLLSLNFQTLNLEDKVPKGMACNESIQLLVIV